MRIKLAAVRAILCLSLLQGCDAGEAGREGDVNGSLKGRIFIGNRFGPWILDLSTGHYQPIPGAIWKNNPHYPGLADFTAYPVAYSGAEYVETVENCSVKSGKERDCIVFHNRKGKVTGLFALPDITLGAARPSRDAKLVAVAVENERRSRGEPFKILHIYDRAGKRLKEITRGTINPHDFDWLPDNRIVYVSGQSIYISGRREPVVTISPKIGVPGEPAVNPSGTQIAFTIGEKLSSGVLGTIWVVNADGTGLRQLTAGERNAASTWHRTPIWSPDGRWVFVIDQTSSEGNAYVVPADGKKIPLARHGGTLAKPVASFFRETIQKGRDSVPLSSQFTVKSGSIAWLP